MKNYIKLIRVKHWLKNGLVFLPLFFSINLLDVSLLFRVVLSFFAFSFASSIVYVVNDINDVEKDRLHPVKKKRPLASGAISIKKAYLVVAFLIALLIGVTTIEFINEKNIFIYLIPVIYIVLNYFYSINLKNIPIIDVVILVSGFLFRVMYGGIVIGVEVSKYLYLMVIFGSFFMGFGKRRNEIIKNGNKSRKVLQLYNKDFLDKNMYVSLALAIVSYTLWCVDPNTIAHIGNDYLFWTIPLVMVILQLYSLDIEGDSHGDPIEVILSDKVLIGVGVIYAASLFVLLYIL